MSSLWIAYGQVWSQTWGVISLLSTTSTKNNMNKIYMQSYTQFCTHVTAVVSTIKTAYFTSVNFMAIHSIHRAYNYNYIYIKKGY